MVTREQQNKLLHPYSVMLVDDHELMRAGVATLLDSELFYVVAEAGSGKQALQEYAAHSPQLVLLDIVMDDLNGLLVAKELRQKYPEAVIVMLTASEDPRDIAIAKHLGVRGYLHKDISVLEFNSTLYQIMASNQTIFPDIEHNHIPVEFDNIHLTGREQDVLRYISRGQANKVIANTLGISEGTVKVHLKNLLQKLGCDNRTQAAYYAFTHRLV